MYLYNMFLFRKQCENSIYQLKEDFSGISSKNLQSIFDYNHLMNQVEQWINLGFVGFVNKSISSNNFEFLPINYAQM